MFKKCPHDKVFIVYHPLNWAKAEIIVIIQKTRNDWSTGKELMFRQFIRRSVSVSHQNDSMKLTREKLAF